MHGMVQEGDKGGEVLNNMITEQILLKCIWVLKFGLFLNMITGQILLKCTWLLYFGLLRKLTYESAFFPHCFFRVGHLKNNRSGIICK